MEPLDYLNQPLTDDEWETVNREYEKHKDDGRQLDYRGLSAQLAHSLELANSLIPEWKRKLFAGASIQIADALDAARKEGVI